MNPGLNLRRRRNKRGSQLAEFGPMVFVILVIIMVPMIDLIYLGLGYCAGWFANHLAVREAACADPNGNFGSGGTSLKTRTQAAQDAVDTFMSSPIGKFFHGVRVSVNVSNKALAASATVTVNTTTVTTVAQILPLLPGLPWFKDIDGLGKAVNFTFADERPQENTGAK